MPMWPFNPASPLVRALANLFTLVMLIAALIFVVVTGLVIYSIIRFRARPGASEPRQVFGIPRLEIVWTAIPILLLVITFVFTVGAMQASDPPVGAQQAPDLVVIGHQWWWEIQYPRTGIVTANEIHLPVGKRMLVELNSFDVIHDFWVPQLGRKIDMTPGYPTHTWLEADTPGVYLGACSEYCGTEHAWMRLRVIVQSQADFDAWQEQQLQVPATPATDEAAQGAQLFQQLTCANCHAIAGTPAQARVGPDLTHVSTRQTLAAGVLDNTPDNLSLWLQDPQRFKPGSFMPNVRLTSDQVSALVAYLESLK